MHAKKTLKGLKIKKNKYVYSVCFSVSMINTVVQSKKLFISSSNFYVIIHH